MKYKKGTQIFWLHSRKNKDNFGNKAIYDYTIEFLEEDSDGKSFLVKAENHLWTPKPKDVFFSEYDVKKRIVELINN